VKRVPAIFALAAAWLAIAVDVLHGGPISHVDVWIADRLQAPENSLAWLALLFWTNLQSTVAILVYSAVFALLLVRRRAWAWALGVAIAVPGGMVLNASLQLAIERSRPVLDNPVLALNTASFPSGHTAAAAVFYGMLAAYLSFRFPNRSRLFLSGAAVLVVLAGLSRMALGVQYFGDVLGALVSSSAWLMACLGGLEAWQAARRSPT
jgi:membrane-associated phospholipid phosphatase